VVWSTCINQALQSIWNYIKNNDDHLGKFDSRVDEGIFLGYATNSKGYICFNKRMHKLVDCIDVRIDEEAPVKDQ
jgi:hypothetical protein